MTLLGKNLERPGGGLHVSKNGRLMESPTDTTDSSLSLSGAGSCAVYARLEELLEGKNCFTTDSWAERRDS